MNVANAIYNGLSDSLSVAIDTGNTQEVADVLASAEQALDEGEISVQHLADLRADSEAAGYDL